MRTETNSEPTALKQSLLYSIRVDSLNLWSIVIKEYHHMHWDVHASCIDVTILGPCNWQFQDNEYEMLQSTNNSYQICFKARLQYRHLPESTSYNSVALSACSIQTDFGRISLVAQWSSVDWHTSVPCIYWSVHAHTCWWPYDACISFPHTLSQRSNEWIIIMIYELTTHLLRDLPSLSSWRSLSLSLLLSWSLSLLSLSSFLWSRLLLSRSLCLSEPSCWPDAFLSFPSVPSSPSSYTIVSSYRTSSITNACAVFFDLSL